MSGTTTDDHITDETPAVAAEPRRSASNTNASRLVRRSARRRERVPTAGGSTLHLLVLSSTLEDTTVVDLATRTVMRVRVPWPDGHDPDISAFDVVEVTLANDPERDDLAQPEATTVADLPRHVGTLRGRHVRKLLRRMVATPDGPLLGFPARRRPIGSFGASDRRWRSLRPPGPSADPATRGRVHVGPLRLGPRGRLAPGGGPTGREGARCGPPRAPERQEPRHGARLRPPVPAGYGEPATRRPLLQGVRRGASPRLTAQRPSLPRPGPRPWPSRTYQAVALSASKLAKCESTPSGS